MKPRFFATPEDFRKWLAEHHESEAELLVGFWKTHTGQPSITWPQSVDEVLCVGWIDGVRKRIDDDSYSIRFTPRRQRSVWSAVNVRRVAELIEEGRMQPAGLAVFEARGEEHATGYSLKERAEHFPKPLEKIFKANKAAWAFWMAQPPGYRRWAVHRVTSAKKGRDAGQATGGADRGLAGGAQAAVARDRGVGSVDQHIRVAPVIGAEADADACRQAQKSLRSRNMSASRDPRRFALAMARTLTTAITRRSRLSTSM